MGMAVEQAVSCGRSKIAERTTAEDQYVDALLEKQAAEDQRQP
jgi:hypothetical protein